MVSSSPQLARRLADAADGALRALAAAGVGVGALAADGQTEAVPDALVGADLDLALDVVGHLAPEVTLDAVLVLDVDAQTLDLLVGEVADPVSGPRRWPRASAPHGCGRRRRCRSGR
jgi:hypothetical protein